MMRDTEIQSHNHEMQQRAFEKLKQLLAVAVSGQGNVRNVAIRVPVHGKKLGRPLTNIERE